MRSSRFMALTVGEAPPPAPAERPPAPLIQVAPLREMEPLPLPKPVNEKLIAAKDKLHKKLIEEMNLSQLEKLSPDAVMRELYGQVSAFAAEERLALNEQEFGEFVTSVYDEMMGLGPLEAVMRDPSINDILINGHQNCFVERFGKLEPINIPFKDEAHLLRIINKIVAAVGRRIDESHPTCDARMLDGSRFNAAIRPIAVDGPLVSIRKFAKKKLSLDRLIDVGALGKPMGELLAAAVNARVTTLISGGTGTGKTTMLNALSAFIAPDERLITIEDAAELQLQQPHVARMETRPANTEGHGEIRQRDLVKNALRMRPDRVILGECRGEEAFDMLQAMNTGHDGSMTTIHANNPRDGISRLENMVAMAGIEMPLKAVRSQIASAVNLIVQASRLQDGSRRMVSITEITGMEGEVISMQEVFRYERLGIEPSGKIIGRFNATGIRSSYSDRFRQWGFDLPASIYEPIV